LIDLQKNLICKFWQFGSWIKLCYFGIHSA
jgi:hypothetical protein